MSSENGSTHTIAQTGRKSLPPSAPTPSMPDKVSTHHPTAQMTQRKSQPHSASTPSSNEYGSTQPTAQDQRKSEPHSTPAPTSSTKCQNKLKCFFTNAQSISSKMKELKCHVANDDYDLIGIAESWLHEDIFNAEIQLPGYQLFRVDRKDRRGGGVALLAKDNLDILIKEDIITVNTMKACGVKLQAGTAN